MKAIDPSHMIHVEFAHFSNLKFFQLFEKHVVRHADSLGMNEQELIMLLELWENKLVDINLARDSKPTIEEILSQLKYAMATPKFCKMTDKLLEEHLENYDVPERPREFTNPGKDGEVIQVERNNLTYKFELGENIQCYLQFFLKCRTLIKTAGLGDTISSTGFIYHKPKQ